MFSDKEKAYLESQHLARLGTVSDDLQPDVAPVGFEFDGEYFYIGGMRNSATRKYKNVAGGNTKVALTIDDLESVDPWKPRGMRIFGTADIGFKPFYPEWIPLIQGVILLTGLYFGLSRGHAAIKELVKTPVLRSKTMIVPAIFALLVVNVLVRLYMG